MTIQDKPAELEDILLREMHHRFCNSLQLISVMAATMLRASPGTDIRDGLERIQDRIGVLGQLHRLLAEPRREGELGPACEALCANLLLTFDRDEARLRIAIDPCPISPVRARGVLLLLAELVTNALKHGAATPDISVRLERQMQRSLLTVRSAGTAPLPRHPRIAASLAESMGGSLAVTADQWFEVQVTLPA